jgi:hypothetical protein
MYSQMGWDSMTPSPLQLLAPNYFFINVFSLQPFVCAGLLYHHAGAKITAYKEEDQLPVDI